MRVTVEAKVKLEVRVECRGVEVDGSGGAVESRGQRSRFKVEGGGSVFGSKIDVKGRGGAV
eukprot:1656793-Rhodomonas_salina.1